MKRIFIAIKIDPGETLLKMISSFKSGLKMGNIKWTNPENIHITLAFLGDTDDALLKAINTTLKEKCEGFGRFDLVLKGAGVFKNLSDPRIIWTGIETSEKLAIFNELVKSALIKASVKIEDRPFKPHLTLGRIKHLKPADGLKELINKYKDVELQKVPVNEVIIYESILLKTGPVYDPLTRLIL